MNEKQLKDAAQLYQSWSAAQLVQATTVERQDYEPAALNLMARELSRRGVSPPERESVEKGVLQAAEDERKHLTGIRGFLLLFVILVVVDSLAYVLRGLAFLGASGLFPLCGVLLLILAGYGFYVHYLLIRKRATAPQHAQRFLILGVLVNALEVLAAWGATHHFDPGSLGVLTGTLVWLGYLNWSRRVANTYGQPEAQAESRDEQPTDAA